MLGVVEVMLAIMLPCGVDGGGSFFWRRRRAFPNRAELERVFLALDASRATPIDD